MKFPKYETKTTDLEVQIWRNDEHIVSVEIEDFESTEQAEFYANESMQMVFFGETMGAQTLIEFIDSLEDNKAYLLKNLKILAENFLEQNVKYSIQGNDEEIVVLREDVHAFTVDPTNFESLDDAVQFTRQTLEFVNHGEIIGARSVSEILNGLNDNEPYTINKLFEIVKNELIEKYGDDISFNE